MSKYVIIIEVEDNDNRPADEAKAALTAALRPLSHRDSTLAADGLSIKVIDVTARV